jgi:predicted nucleotide-binding protein
MSPSTANSVFIGHGRSALWRELKDFLQDRLLLAWDEFNRESVAGVATTERITQMLESATFALLVMTGEDEHADSTFHARENVVHEMGLFQGKLGLRRAVVLLEDGCKVFSNIHGLSYIPFPRGHIASSFEEIRRVLERERIIGT